MKKKDIFLLAVLLGIALTLIIFSSEARQGAYDGLILAENTIIPSLMPLLIIFLLIMKTGARDALAKAFGFVSVYAFNLPEVTFPAIFLGLIGGYPTGALLTQELYNNQEIDNVQAKRMLRFNFCGGCGFIITAVGNGVLQSTRAGTLLFASNIISAIIIGFALSFRERRSKSGFYSFSESVLASTALYDATEGAINAVLNITAFVILFNSINSILTVPSFLAPLIEITSGVCTHKSFSLPLLSAYLAFGGICIHLQTLPIIIKCGMKYADFLASRAIASLLSYIVCRLLSMAFPESAQVFSNSSEQLAVFSSVNVALSFLLIIGCFVIVLDLRSRKRYLDN